MFVGFEKQESHYKCNEVKVTVEVQKKKTSDVVGVHWEPELTNTYAVGAGSNLEGVDSRYSFHMGTCGVLNFCNVSSDMRP